MKARDIKTKINWLFFIVFILSCACFVISLILTTQNHFQERDANYQEITKSLINQYISKPNSSLSQILLGNDFSYVKSVAFSDLIRVNGKKLFDIKSGIEEFTFYAYGDRFFLEAKTKDHEYMMQIDRKDSTFEFIFLGFLISLGLVVFLYFSIINSLTPLERLREEVAAAAYNQKFIAQGYNNDEIGKIAFEFEKSMRKNHELVESRQLFLRSIMHELKTPIGKGRIIAEMIKEEKQKSRLISVFERLNLLINEAARIESLFSRNYYLDVHSYKISQILQQVENFLMLDNFKEKVKIDMKEDFYFEVDLEVFALMLKNLIDNAIKHSNDHQCFIEIFQDQIIIKNKGNALEMDFKEYIKAFVRDKNTGVEGMGLGLYIVESICRMHNFSLAYDYKEGYHYFSIFKIKEDKDGKQGA
ncbi:sensor histidine kinase [Campylobacter sp. MIT 99-7217]|uniref:ArsS family sensor histidine kinase n=1 Tax=Campylobacter sp. MIT 99-7217 TaxID=535091 RepID=UPI001156DCB2|nr:ArsS family sensor histidine kinase [Campylobacter sp. MIT 99-7217]TQR29540.1 sensor histidine kinase [Campylobacter sp. MIT 99-7217]